MMDMVKQIWMQQLAMGRETEEVLEWRLERIHEPWPRACRPCSLRPSSREPFRSMGNRLEWIDQIDFRTVLQTQCWKTARFPICFVRLGPDASGLETMCRYRSASRVMSEGTHLGEMERRSLVAGQFQGEDGKMKAN